MPTHGMDRESNINLLILGIELFASWYFVWGDMCGASGNLYLPG